MKIGVDDVGAAQLVWGELAADLLNPPDNTTSSRIVAMEWLMEAITISTRHEDLDLLLAPFVRFSRLTEALSTEMPRQYVVREESIDASHLVARHVLLGDEEPGTVSVDVLFGDRPTGFSEALGKSHPSETSGDPPWIGIPLQNPLSAVGRSDLRGPCLTTGQHPGERERLSFCRRVGGDGLLRIEHSGNVRGLDHRMMIHIESRRDARFALVVLIQCTNYSCNSPFSILLDVFNGDQRNIVTGVGRIVTWI